MVGRFGWDLLSFVLMPNHFHLFLRTRQPNLSRACSTSSTETPTGTPSGIGDRATSPRAASKPLWSRMSATSGPSADTFTSTRHRGTGLWPRIRLTGRGQAIPATPGGETASAGVFRLPGGPGGRGRALCLWDHRGELLAAAQ